MFWQEGDLIYKGQYRIEKYLGGGGFAVTYQAFHTQLKRRVVIKTPNISIQRDPEYPKYVERFKKEAQMLAMCCADFHPYIVQIFNFFQDDGCCYLEMQYIPGETLWHYVQREGVLQETEAVKYIYQIGSALVYVHKKGVFHLDVTPPNIMLNFDEGVPQVAKAVLIDFGIAGDMSPPSTLSRTFGNKTFAPYELIRKGTRHPTVDVYCLAGSLYYAITGKCPTKAFDRSDGEELVPPKLIVPTLNDALNEAILQGMAFKPEDRPQTMQDWLNLLSIQESFSALEEDFAHHDHEELVPPEVIVPTLNNKLNEVILQEIAPEPQDKPQSTQAHLNSSVIQAPSSSMEIDIKTDYLQLENALKARKWLEADQKTIKVLLKIAGRQRERWLDIESIRKCSTTELSTIDKMWMTHSNKRFGFSVQKWIWRSIGGNREADFETWFKFCDKVGWRVDDKYVEYHKLKQGYDAPKGHFPCYVYTWCLGQGADWGRSASELFDKL
ncbi:serine/threonine-protein kinase [Nostoc parmelioides]|uniref:non-specific serine/threonine protein kinase n=1 Tax=Nostoc parmelioides FACHB-3921 TaxID=2692909 RepID=A0ABR8BI30_9NOSO|nr:serine/threonine-protein kinase [Nostoc parmelioides]MBD2253155.1 GUN4 domain-containing protein [Nostoc parmelioides FACHB-3921]